MFQLSLLSSIPNMGFSFSTRFTVTKDLVTGMPNLHPHSGSLVEYNGFRVDASEDPCFAPY
jgi:hypothetical protein